MTLLKITVQFTLYLSLCISSVYAQEKSKNMEKATNYFYEKKYAEAIKYFQKEYQNNPSISIKFWIALSYAEMEEVSKAKPLFLEIIKSDHVGPEIAMSLTNLGICYQLSKQMDSAYFYYNQVIKRFPNMASGYFNKANLLYSESKFIDAKIHLDRAIDIEPNDWLFYEKRTEVCFVLRDFECALNDLLKTKTLNPDLKIEVNLAYCYSMMKRYEEADSIFQIIYDEKNPFILNNYGLNKHNLGKSEEGKKLILKSLSIDPENPYAYRNLAIIAISENETSKICEYLYKAKLLNFEKYYGTEVNELLKKHCN